MPHAAFVDFDDCDLDVAPQQIAEGRRRQFLRLQGMADARLREIARALGRRHDRELFEHALRA